jgi:hypothetical protein
MTDTRASRRLTAARVILTLLCLWNLAVGVYATAAPRGFYDNVLGVDALPPYNQHLLTDVGGLYLGFGVLLAWAAVTLGRQLTRAACAAVATSQVVHSAYHIAHLERLGTGEAVIQTIGLAAGVVLPICAVLLLPPTRP